MSGRHALYQITAPHFCAALYADDTDVVSTPAPILRYMVGWSMDKVRRYCDHKGWTIYDLREMPDERESRTGD